jgi:hypothetical protein
MPWCVIRCVCVCVKGLEKRGEMREGEIESRVEEGDFGR